MLVLSVVFSLGGVQILGSDQFSWPFDL